MKKVINVGIIGFSDGNGHPFSWSAIINGFNKKKLNKCPFPIIRKYLGDRQNFDDVIDGVNVTHIWTQSRDYSEMVSEFAYIPNIVNSFHDMIGCLLYTSPSPRDS